MFHEAYKESANIGTSMSTFWLYISAYIWIILIIFTAWVALKAMLLLFYRGTRNRTIFISFHHNYHEIANTITDALQNSKIEVTLIKFSHYNYDSLISMVKNALINCDCVIVIPGDDISFVDAEVLSASVLNKPIFFIAPMHNVIPDTALSGYPIFSWDVISRNRCSAIAYFVRLIAPSASEYVLRSAAVIKDAFLFATIRIFIILFAISTVEVMVSIACFRCSIWITQIEEGFFAILICFYTTALIIFSAIDMKKFDNISRQTATSGQTKKILIDLLKYPRDSQEDSRKILIEAILNEEIARRKVPGGLPSTNTGITGRSG